MGTFEASKIRTAAQDYVCGNFVPNRGCGDVIKRGDRYLSFAPGHRGRIPICLHASGHESVEGCAFETTPIKGPMLKYNCADMLAEISRSEKGG